MADTYTHFGAVVKYGVYDNYKKLLSDNGVSYRRLPILEHEVICYDNNGQKTYAVIGSDDENDIVIATTEVPEDGWASLVDDVYRQKYDGEAPAAPQSYLKVLLQELISDVEKEHRSSDVWGSVFNSFEKTNPDDFYAELRKRLTIYGFDSTASAHDVDPAYIAKIFGVK